MFPFSYFPPSYFSELYFGFEEEEAGDVIVVPERLSFDLEIESSARLNLAIESSARLNLAIEPLVQLDLERD